MALSENKAIINECRNFLKNDVNPGVLEADLGEDTDWIKKIWKKSMGLDLPFLSVPEAYEGAGYSDATCALVLDALSSECSGLASVFAYHYTACLLGEKGNDAQKKSFFHSLIQTGNAPSPVYTVIFGAENDEERPCVSEENGELYLNGGSGLTGNTMFAEKIFVFARDGNSDKSITCILLNREEKGISFGENAKIPGLKVNPFVTVSFDHIRLTEEHIFGERGKGDGLLKEACNTFFSFISAMSMGAVRRSWQKAYEYAGERYQFGKEIIHHQEIQRMLGEMLMKLKTGTSAYMALFNDEDTGINYACPDASLTKAFCTDVALEIIIDAIQIHGGYGYMHEFGLEKIMRDVKVLQVLGGKNPCHHIEAISQKVNGTGK